MSAVTLPRCVGEPVSWLRLETFALDGRDASVRDHVAACPACKQCLDEIQRDVVALPVLIVSPRRRWWQFALPGAIAIAAAALVLFLLRPRDESIEGETRVKGIGEVVVDVVRERNGSIRDDVRTFAEGDRFKIVVTCPPQKSAQIDVSILEEGAGSADHPLATTQLACGNRVVIPGAFTLTGTHEHRVCVQVTSVSRHTGAACLTLRPE